MAQTKVTQLKSHIDPSLCIGCGACILHCPAHAITMMPGWVSHVEQETCTGCGNCVNICHKHAPYME